MGAVLAEAVTAQRQDLERRAAAAMELARRRALSPLAYATLWHRDPPRTSQREAVRPWADPGTFILLVLGGNRAGKSDVLAQMAVATAAGRDAWVWDDVRKMRVYYVREWLARNQLPADMISAEGGDVWVGSPTWGSALEQIRPKIKKLVPAGSKFNGWDNDGPADIELPNGPGCIIAKAYRQYVQEAQTWEGAAVRGIFLDEEPASEENIAAAMSRTVDYGAKIMIAVTILSGKGGWFNQKYVVKKPQDCTIRYIYGRDNPHIGAEDLERMFRNLPKWQRASRESGVATSPEGAIWPIDAAVHVTAPFLPPAEWKRYQGWDWGSRSPHCVWAAESPGEHTLPDGKTLRKGDLICYREYAPRIETTEPGLTDRRFIQEAMRVEERDAEGASVSFRVADSESPGAIAEAADLGLWLIPAAKGAGSVVAGLDLCEALLTTIDSVTQEPVMPRLFFTEDCPTLIEEATNLRWAKVREGAAKKPDDGCADHGPDCVRYIVQLRHSMGFR